MTYSSRKILISLIAFIALQLGPTLGRTQSQEPSCLLIQQALTDYGRIKVGVTRRDVERYFTPDGGAQFPGATRYVYLKCAYMHVDIEFDAKGTLSKGLFSADDVVTKTSKLYVDYSAKD
jgi:hypothetical protein